MKQDLSDNTVRIYNRSKQMVPIQVQPPNSDFYDQQSVYLQPGQTVRISKKYLHPNQVENLQKRQELQVVFDSEK